MNQHLHLLKAVNSMDLVIGTGENDDANISYLCKNTFAISI